MDIWVLTAWDTVGELRNEVMSLLFDEELVIKFYFRELQLVEMSIKKL